MGFRSSRTLLFLSSILVAFFEAVNASPCQGLRHHRKDIECNQGVARRASLFSAGNYALEVAGGSAWFLTCLVLFRCFRPRKESHVDEPPIATKNSTSSSISPRKISSDSLKGSASHGAGFTLEELTRITGNFSSSHKMGTDKRTSTYRGKLRDGTIVLVKRAKKDALDTRQGAVFQNELSMLSDIEHWSLVKLLGYLETDKERMFVTEYVPNGTLREHLDGIHGIVLEFNTRLDIAIDVAHGLTYLHTYAGNQPIIHRDVSSSNVFLTDTFRAKVANFGFSRAGASETAATHVTTEVKGTAGYLDPEYLQTYQLTPKSDVFSFGVLLIEIFSGRRPIELHRSSEERITVRWAFDLFKSGRIDEILDPKLPKNPTLIGILERLTEVAFKCVAPTRTNRPTMKEAAETMWNIRKDYQALATTPRASDRHTPLNSPLRTPGRNSNETPRSRA